MGGAPGSQPGVHRSINVGKRQIPMLILRRLKQNPPPPLWGAGRGALARNKQDASDGNHVANNEQ